MHSKINSRMAGFDRRRSGLIFFLLLVATGFLLPSLACAVPIATTQVSKLCETRAGGDRDFDQNDAAFQPFGQATTCNVYAVGTYQGQYAMAGAEGYASAGFGPGFPQIGMTSASAQVTAVNAIAEANLVGSVQYYFEIQPLKAAPAGSPQFLPALFSAVGAGHISKDDNSLARAQGIASLSGPVGNQAWFSFDLTGVPTTGGFDQTASLTVYPNTYGGATYVVVLSAACSTWVSAVSSSSATCSATVGPSFLGFDQAAFDVTMGANTFSLNEYYAFVVSENVPLPPAVWLFGSGLLGLIAFARRHRH